MKELLVFRAGAQTFGIPVSQVGVVFPVAEIDPLPNAPGTIRGIVNIHGTVTPVIDLQRRFTHIDATPHLDQRLILAFVGSRQFALLADDVDGVQRIPDASITDMEIAVPGAGIVTTVAASGAGLIYIYDVDALLAASEEALLDAALREA
jgi:purine-binding chemotaxis protein CheW